VFPSFSKCVFNQSRPTTLLGSFVRPNESFVLGKRTKSTLNGRKKRNENNNRRELRNETDAGTKVSDVVAFRVNLGG
jgi:hypothetical protein